MAKLWIHWCLYVLAPVIWLGNKLPNGFMFSCLLQTHEYILTSLLHITSNRNMFFHVFYVSHGFEMFQCMFQRHPPCQIVFPWMYVCFVFPWMYVCACFSRTFGWVKQCVFTDVYMHMLPRNAIRHASCSMNGLAVFSFAPLLVVH